MDCDDDVDAADARHGGNHHDRPLAALAHPRDRRPAEVIEGMHVDAERLMPCLRRHVEQPARHQSARRMHEHVDGTELPGGFVHAAGRVVGLAHVGNHHPRAATEGLDFRLHLAGRLVVVAAVDRHVGPGGSQFDRRGGADPFRPSGHQSHFAGKQHDDVSASVPMILMGKPEA